MVGGSIEMLDLTRNAMQIATCSMHDSFVKFWDIGYLRTTGLKVLEQKLNPKMKKKVQKTSFFDDM